MRQFKCYGHTKNTPKNNKNKKSSAKCQVQRKKRTKKSGQVFEDFHAKLNTTQLIYNYASKFSY